MQSLQAVVSVLSFTPSSRVRFCPQILVSWGNARFRRGARFLKRVPSCAEIDLHRPGSWISAQKRADMMMTPLHTTVSPARTRVSAGAVAVGRRPGARG